MGGVLLQSPAGYGPCGPKDHQIRTRARAEIRRPHTTCQGLSKLEGECLENIGTGSFASGVDAPDAPPIRTQASTVEVRGERKPLAARADRSWSCDLPHALWCYI